jgi:hypothetical protein
MDILTRPGGAAGAFAAVRQLDNCSLGTCQGVLAAVAGGCRQLAEADSAHSLAGSEIAAQLPAAEQLASWRELASTETVFSWSIPNFLQQEGSMRSPEIEAIGFKWHLSVYPRGNTAPDKVSFYLACASVSGNPVFETPPIRFALELLNQVRPDAGGLVLVAISFMMRHCWLVATLLACPTGLQRTTHFGAAAGECGPVQ